MNNNFGNWLAGFADGEGCFSISFSNGWRLCFSIVVRRDDRPILVEIQERTGLGRIYDYSHGGKNSSKSKPQSAWQVYKKDEVTQLVSLFRKFPLRAKKARDFEVWAAAVEFWTSGSSRNTDWSYMIELQTELREARQFQMQQDG